MKHYIYITLLLTSLIGFSQEECEEILSTIEVEGGFIVSSKINGTSVPETPDIPVVSKIDYNGDEVWRTEGDITGINNGGISEVNVNLFSDGYLYVLFTFGQTPSFSKKIWKINIVDGTLIWEKEFPQSYSSYNYERSGLIDYDTDNLLLYYPIYISGVAGSFGANIYIINKLTAVSELVHTSDRDFEDMVKDSKGNLYHTYIKQQDDADPIFIIRKVNGTNFNNIIWEKEFYSIEAFSPTFKFMHINKQDEIFVFIDKPIINVGAGADLFKLNSRDGSQVWSLNTWSSSSYKFHKNSLFISRSNGSDSTTFRVSKVNLENGTLEWVNNELDITVIGNISNYQADYEYVSFFDIDCNGDIYVAGRYGALQSYSSGTCVIMKVDGQTGEKINDITVSYNYDEVDEYCKVRSFYHVNDECFLFGELQTIPGIDATSNVFVKTDADLSTIIDIKSFCDNDYDNDNVIDINDDCPELPGVIANNGCPLDLPYNNFTIETFAQTCVNTNNAKIAINANEDYTYEVTLSINNNNITLENDTFTNSLIINNLFTGVFELCISIPSENYTQCYNIEISAPSNLTGSSNTENELYTLTLVGAEIYNIDFNNQTYTINASDSNTPVVFQNQLTQEINTIEVTSDRLCQGKFKETISTNNLKLYPNPTNDNLYLSINSNSKNADLKVYDITGKIMLNKTVELPLIDYRINTINMNSGVYFVQLISGNNVFRQKFIKN